MSAPWTLEDTRGVIARLVDSGAVSEDQLGQGSVDLETAHAVLTDVAHGVRTHPAEPGNGTEILVRSPAMSMFLLDVEAEAQAAQRKFPGNADKVAATTEECGELARALLQHKYGKGEPRAVYLEAVQLAAMAAQVALGGDSAFPYRFETAFHLGFAPTGAATKGGAA